jgi:TRAP transporter 4TM/12TM fusion protein
LDILLAGLSFAITYYYLSTIEDMFYRQGEPNTMDIIMSTCAVGLVLEATRRTIGWVMAFLASCFLLYGVFGAYFPDLISHAGIGWDWMASFLFLSTEGIYGIPIGVTATFVFLFVLFTNAIRLSGGDKVIADLAAVFLGGTRGGSGKACVFMGLLIGMISGSPVADAAAVGSLTIPLMKKKGFRPIFAAALTAISANGGALMPPVMGAAAFIMVEFINRSYWEICIAAILPALLYYFSAYMAADFEAARQGIGGIPKEERPELWPVIKDSIIFVGPFVVLLIWLGYLSSTPQRAATVALVTLVAIYFILQIFVRKEMTPRKAFIYFITIFESGTKGMLTIIATCACAGVIVGVINLSGLGMQLSSILVDLSGGNLLAMLLLTMVASLILGMGLPVTACYIILAVLAAPVLIQQGVSPIGAHLFVFYFGIVSGLTPPVALTAYVAAGIANTPIFRTGFYAFVVAFITFLIPYVFVYDPSLMFEGPLYQTAITFVVCAISVVALTAGVMGYLFRPCNWIERAVMIVAAIGIIVPELYSTLIGLAVFGVIVAIQFMQQRSLKRHSV